MPNESPRYFLEAARQKALAELRRKVPELIRDYLKYTAAIEAMDREDVSGEYQGIYKPLDAIEAFLDNTGRAATREQIAKAIADSGWGIGRVQRPYNNLLTMLDYHLGTKEPPLKERNGLIGKADWGEEMFTEEKEGEA